MVNASAAFAARGKMYKRYTFEHLARARNSRGRKHKIVMKKKEEEVRRKMVVVRMNEKEFRDLRKFKAGSTEKTMSNYLRKVALNQPVTVIYRNGTADDFMAQMLQLKKELNALGNNFNQAVHKLHTLDRIPEFRNWIRHYETVHHQFVEKADQILVRSNQIYQLWLQE